MTIKTKVENLMSVMGCIIDEWQRNGEASSVEPEEFQRLYDDVCEIYNDLDKYVG